MPRLLSIALAEPCQGFADRSDRRADGLSLRLHQIDIFRIAQGLLEQQFVDRSATTKSDLVFQCRRVKQIAQRAADDQVLLDLPRVGPRGCRTPGLDVGTRNQKSISTGSLITSFHRASFS